MEDGEITREPAAITESVYAVARHGDRWSVFASDVRELSGRSGIRCVRVFDEPKAVFRSTGVCPLSPSRRFYSEVCGSGSRLLLVPSTGKRDQFPYACDLPTVIDVAPLPRAR
jgi:hypothetical protein